MSGSKGCCEMKIASGSRTEYCEEVRLSCLYTDCSFNHFLALNLDQLFLHHLTADSSGTQGDKIVPHL